MQLFASRRRPHVLVACQPKSGSTFLTTALAALPEMRLASLVPGYDRREQEICERLLRRNGRFAYAAQLHVRRSSTTDALIERYGLHVVVLVRDLFDAAISLRDHLRRESVVLPMAHFSPEHATNSDRDLEAMIARCAMPWYVNFYMGWRTFDSAILVRYRDLIGDPHGVVRGIADAVGIEASDADVRRAVESAGGARFNVGVTGRGASLHPEAEREILGLLQWYPKAAGDPYVAEMLARAASKRPTPPAAHAAFFRDAA